MDASAQGINLPKIFLLSALFLLAAALFSDKFQCSFPRVLDVTLPRSQPDPGNGCDGSTRLDQFAKRFKQQNVAAQVLKNLMQKEITNKRQVFRVEELVKVMVKKDGSLNMDAIKYLATNGGVGIGFLTELFEILVSCGHLNKKTQKPDFDKVLKEFKKPIPKPKVPEKTPRKPANPKDGDNLDDFHMW